MLCYNKEKNDFAAVHKFVYLVSSFCFFITQISHIYYLFILAHTQTIIQSDSQLIRNGHSIKLQNNIERK